MLSLHSISRSLVLLLALGLATACGGADPQAPMDAAEKAGALDSVKNRTGKIVKANAERGQRSRDSVRAARVHFASEEDTLALTLEELVKGPHVLIRNPTARTDLRMIIEDERETHPLSVLLALPTPAPVVPPAAKDRPGTVLLKLARGAAAPAPWPGPYDGRLLVVSDTGGVHARRAVRITVPEPLPKALTTSPDTGWTAAIYKLAPLPPARAWLFDNAEGRCARDNRDREGFAASRPAALVRFVVGTCTRDNVIPLEGALTRGMRSPPGAPSDSAKAAQGAAGSTRSDTVIAKRPPQVLLGVLHAEKGGDQALVWWTADSLNVGGARRGVELQFTSFDHPGNYYGKIDLARAGAEGVVGLRVRVMHDWPLALFAIFVGVFLSWWLRNYVRTRRAVLKMQEFAADLVSRIVTADEQLRLVESSVPGYQPYAVDESLLAALRRLERQLQQHAYDGTVLEPGKPEHDALRKQLEEAEANVALWEGLAAILGDLRLALAVAEEREAQLRGGNGAPALLHTVEKLFSRDRLTTAKVAALDEEATTAEEAVRCWNDVALDAVELKRRLAGASADDEGVPEAGAALDAAVAVLWTVATADAAKQVGPAVAAAAKLYRPRQKMLKIFTGRGGAGESPAATHDAPAVRHGEDRAPAADFAAVEPPVTDAAPPVPDTAPAVPGGVREAAFAGSVAGEAPGPEEAAPAASADEERSGRDHAALKLRRERETLLRATAEKARLQAESRRKWNDRKYFVLTLAVAAATGLNQLYFVDGGFGTMKDYMVALLWGFGTKMGLDTVRTAVEAGRLPFQKAAGAQSQPETQPSGAGAATSAPAVAAPNAGAAGVPVPSQPGGGT